MALETQNISISYQELETETETETNFNIDQFIANINRTNLTNNNVYNNFLFSKMIDYNINTKVKELLLICDYYGLAKNMKINKYNKEQIIHFLVVFESNPINYDIVCKRQNMWFYINQLKNDKFMKKFVIW